MNGSNEVTIEQDGKRYGATFSVSDGMLHVKTHTETRSLELGDQDAQTVARHVLLEIVNAKRIG